MLALDINGSLVKLRDLALTTDYKVAAERKVFFDAVIDIKVKYQKIESLLSKDPVPKIVPPAIRMYISRVIHPNQMEGYVAKIQANVPKLLTELSVEKVRIQYILLDSIVKILNGDAYLVGCTHATPVPA
jgi:hypothetical protein